MDFELEIRELQRRVGDLEGAVSVLAGQIGSVGPRLAALQEKEEAHFATLSRSLGDVMRGLDTMNTQIWSLRDDLPLLVRQALGHDPAQGN